MSNHTESPTALTSLNATEYLALRTRLQAEGWSAYIMPEDAAIARNQDCETCGRRLNGEGFIKRNGRKVERARVFAVCPKCGAAWEF